MSEISKKMSIYNGVALFQEKQAVVLDLGTDYTKFGFTGEAAPRCIIRSEFWCPERRCYKRVHDYSTPLELYDNLVNMLHLLYFRHVLVNPKERKVVVVESLLSSTMYRETLAKVLYIHYEVSGVIWADSPRLCAMTLGVPIALIVSIGAEEVEVVPVIHGCVVLQVLQSQPLGARAIHAELARLVDEDNGRQLNLPPHVIEDIKVKTCYVIGRERALQWESDNDKPLARDVEFPVGGGRCVRVSGRARELAAEVLFRRDAECASLPDAVLRAIMNAPLDTRRALAASVAVVGGGAALPGLRARLAAELRAITIFRPYLERLRGIEFKFHAAPAHDNAVAWCGGALLGGAAAGGATPRVTPRDVYFRERRLRDWPNLLDNTPPDHPQRRSA